MARPIEHTADTLATFATFTAKAVSTDEITIAALLTIATALFAIAEEISSLEETVR